MKADMTPRELHTGSFQGSDLQIGFFGNVRECASFLVLSQQDSLPSVPAPLEPSCFEGLEVRDGGLLTYLGRLRSMPDEATVKALFTINYSHGGK